MGMGKSGNGRKTAATLASTGTPAMFTRGSRHGDLGMIKSVDVVLAISTAVNPRS